MKRGPGRSAFLLTLILLIHGRTAEAGVLPPPGTSNLYVSSFGTDEVHCYAPDGRFLFKFGHADLSGPRGLAFGAGLELHVAAQHKDRVLVFSEGGSYDRQFTGGGLDQPTSLAFGPDETLFVSSFGTNEVLIFRDDVFVRAITANGLRGPNCIAFGAAGDFYVASQITSEVFRFAPDGTATGRFTGGGLSSAMGIALLGEELHVTGGSSHSVVVFDLAGKHLRTIQGSSANPVLSAPQGIAFDSDGNFAVSSFSTGNVGLYSRDGMLLRQFEASGVKTARSVAFLGEARERAFIRGDLNTNGSVDISDALTILFELFIASQCDPCLDEGDADDNGLVQITDAIYVLDFLFLGGPAPPAPFPEAGPDPTPADGLTCRSGRSCRE